MADIQDHGNYTKKQRQLEAKVSWPSSLRRWFKAPVISMAVKLAEKIYSNFRKWCFYRGPI